MEIIMAIMEYSFELSDFGLSTEYDESISTMIRLQRLIMMKKGSDTNDPEKGVDIASYISEDLTPFTISEIRTEINAQVVKYLPEINISDLEIEILDAKQLDTTITKALDISIKYKVSDEDVEKTATLKLVKQKNSSNVFSRIVF